MDASKGFKATFRMTYAGADILPAIEGYERELSELIVFKAFIFPVI